MADLPTIERAVALLRSGDYTIAILTSSGEAITSLDPVALDQACLELIHGVKCDEHNNNKPLLERIAARHGAHTIDYAEHLGMGSKEYELVEVE